MRILVNAAFVALCVVPTLGIEAASAADLDHIYEPPPPVGVLPPPLPPCGYDEPCVRPYRPPLAFLRPRYYYYGHLEPNYHHVYNPYNYEHDGYGRPRQNIDRYGYDRPPGQPYEHLGYDRLDRYGDQERRRENERYERRHLPPYAYEPG